MENLNKENFFNDLQQRFPKAMEHFCKWIDKYKEENSWDELFNDGKAWAGGVTIAPKFHDLPYDMQVGVILRYVSEVIEHEDKLTMEEIKDCFKAGLIYLEIELPCPGH